MDQQIVQSRGFRSHIRRSIIYIYDLVPDFLHHKGLSIHAFLSRSTERKIGDATAEGYALRVLTTSRLGLERGCVMAKSCVMTCSVQHEIM